MSSTPLDVVTGAFSHTGRHIADQPLAGGRSVRTLSRNADSKCPYFRAKAAAEVGLAADLLVSAEPPRAQRSFAARVQQNGAVLDRTYSNELTRNFRGRAPL